VRILAALSLLGSTALKSRLRQPGVPDDALERAWVNGIGKVVRLHRHQSPLTADHADVLGVATFDPIFFEAVVPQYRNDFTEFEGLHIPLRWTGMVTEHCYPITARPSREQACEEEAQCDGHPRPNGRLAIE